METQVQELSPTLVEVQVQIPWDQVRQELEGGYKRVAKNARVRGFRPGKVPRNVVRQLYGKQIKGEVTAQLIEQGLMQAIQEHELQVVAQPQLDPPQIEEGQPFAFSAQVEVRPKVENVDLSQLELYRGESTEVADEDVDKELDRLREQHAEVRVPEPMRAAREGDQLTIDYTVSVDGEQKDELAASDRQVEIGSGRLLPEFDEGLKGLQPGDETDLEVTFDDDHGREELQGKTARFHVTVKELREKTLPELDDEFAKDVGDYETLLELRLKVRQDLEETARQRSDAQLKEQVVDKLIETNEITVPDALIQQQQQQMMQEFSQFLNMSGQNMPVSEELQQSMQPRADRRVRAGILLGAVARQEGIEVTEQDLESKFQELAEQSGKHIAKVRAEYQGEDRQTLESQLLEQKLMDFLLSRATIHDGPPPESDTGASEQEEPTGETEAAGATGEGEAEES